MSPETAVNGQSVAPNSTESTGSTPTSRVTVTAVARSLDFYLDVGCEVRRAADGWVELSWGQTRFALVPSAPFPPHVVTAASNQDVIRVTASDIRALRRRLLAKGITWSTIRDGRSGLSDIEVTDPDGQRIVIHQSRPTST